MDEEPERFRVEFASGTAASVEKRRSFRDHERNDIEPDLPGWPPGEAFAVRGSSASSAGTSLPSSPGS